MFFSHDTRMATTNPRANQRKRRIVIGILVAMLILAIADYFFYPLLPIGGINTNTGQNGAWIRYTWYFGHYSEADQKELAKNLQRRQIRYAFFHVRYIKKDGTLKFRYPNEAQKLNRTINQNAPATMTLAWIYAGRDQVDLSKPEIRKTMVQQAVWLTQECGFDGVQWDYEICPDGDESQLKLLHETRQALGMNKLLSVAAAMNYPWPLGRFGWTENYFTKLAKDCDQICIMGYDSGLYFPRAYAALLKRQIKRIPKVVHESNPECKVLLGVPTYEDGPPSHNPHAENLKIALKAAREAKSSQLNGIAVFADYTTDSEEWRLYERYWLDRR